MQLFFRSPGIFKNGSEWSANRKISFWLMPMTYSLYTRENINSIAKKLSFQKSVLHPHTPNHNILDLYVPGCYLKQKI